MRNFACYFCFWPLVLYQNASFSLSLIPGHLLEQIPCLSEEEQHLIPLMVIATGVPCQETAPKLTFKLWLSPADLTVTLVPELAPEQAGEPRGFGCSFG